MCGESWLATKVLQAIATVLKAGHPGVLFFVGLFSGCLIVCFVVARLFVWVGWLGVFLSIFTAFYIAGVLCTCTSMYNKFVIFFTFEEVTTGSWEV